MIETIGSILKMKGPQIGFGSRLEVGHPFQFVGLTPPVVAVAFPQAGVKDDVPANRVNGRETAGQFLDGDLETPARLPSQHPSTAIPEPARS